MARYTGAKLRITRRLGDLPGLTSKKGKINTTTWSTWCNTKKINTICNSSRRKTKTSF